MGRREFIIMFQHWLINYGKRNTVSPTHTNLQVVNFQRHLQVQSWKLAHVSGVHCHMAACPPSPVADSPSALPSPTSSPSSIRNSSGLFTPCQPLSAQLLCGTTMLFKVLNCKIKICFVFWFFWRIPWREEPGRLQSMGSQRVGHN